VKTEDGESRSSMPVDSGLNEGDCVAQNLAAVTEKGILCSSGRITKDSRRITRKALQSIFSHSVLFPKLEVIDIKFLNHTILEYVALSFVKELSMSGTTYLWMLILVP